MLMLEKSTFYHHPRKDQIRQESSMNAKTKGEFPWGAGYLHYLSVSPWIANWLHRKEKVTIQWRNRVIPEPGDQNLHHPGDRRTSRCDTQRKTWLHLCCIPTKNAWVQSHHKDTSKTEWGTFYENEGGGGSVVFKNRKVVKEKERLEMLQSRGG